MKFHSIDNKYKHSQLPPGKQITSASDRASAIKGATPPSRPIAMLSKDKEYEIKY